MDLAVGVVIILSAIIWQRSQWWKWGERVDTEPLSDEYEVAISQYWPRWKRLIAAAMPMLVLFIWRWF